MTGTETGLQKTRRVFGFTFQQKGIVTPGEPVYCDITLPKGATFRGIQVDGGGNFVLFAECWSHAEGTEVTHETEEWMLISDHDIPAGWQYVHTIMTMNKVFHFFKKGTPELVVVGG